MHDKLKMALFHCIEMAVMQIRNDIYKMLSVNMYVYNVNYRRLPRVAIQGDTDRNEYNGLQLAWCKITVG